MRRLTFGLAALLIGGCVGSPTPQKPPALIGVIQGVSADLAKPRMDALRSGLEALGYKEGRDFTLELRLLEGGADRAAELTTELIGKGAAFIVTGNTAGVDGARRATTTVPVLMAGAGADPVGDGWVTSLSRPGGNVTGISFVVPTLPGKRLQLLREIVPSAQRIGVLNDATAPKSAKTLLEDAAASLGIALEIADAKDLNDVEAAFRAFSASGVKTAHVTFGGFIPAHMPEIARLATAQRIATSWAVTEGARAGGLFSIGPEQADLYRRTAAYIDKIMKGARPGELPVEQPQKLELIINMKTAQAIGIVIPGSVLAQATELIR